MKTDSDNLKISIGNISVLIQSNTDFIAEIRDIYTNFINDGENPSIFIKVQVVTSEEFVNELTYMADSPDVNIDEFSGLCTINWQNFHGEFNLRNREGILQCINHTGLSNFIRIIYSLILLEETGFLVHASSLIKNGKGYLFPGKSGAGKTTITRLSPDAILLTDEVSLVKMVNGKFNIYGTPFWGELAVGGENLSVPIEAVYFPVKDKKNSINSIGASKALEKLLPNVLFFVNEPKYNLKLFNLCNDFVDHVSANELHFVPSPEFWRLIDVE